MSSYPCSRRRFLRLGLSAAAAAPFASHLLRETMAAAVSQEARAKAKVAIVRCPGYGTEVKGAYKQAFDLLGGIGTLVKDKTVTVKLNLTGTNFTDYMDRSVGETYMTHYATAAALTSALFANGAKRVRFVESTQSRSTLESTLSLADWDVNALKAMGTVEFENTRNLGLGKSYARFKVPDGGRMFTEL